MTVPFVLLVLGALTAALAPRLLARADWPDREPVLALWVWQCVIVGVLLCCVSAMALCASAAWAVVRGHVFALAPRGVVDAYGLAAYGRWAGVLAVLLACGGAWTAAMLTREVRGARARHRRRRAELLVRSPRLLGELPAEGGERLVVLESERAEAWWLAGSRPQLVVTTAALRRLQGRQLDAVLAHEQGHARARHDWLLAFAYALAAGFPQVPVFAGFRHQVHRLVELAADDVASRRFGRLTTALALVELNEDRGVFGPCPTPLAQLPGRVHRLLDPAPRLTRGHRMGLTAMALLVPVVPLLVAFGPGIGALT
ncbi:M56 family metallopeptidase [Streptomyces sp. RB6PN25]|uniref:M56 family metallopeptidase n=1 Tax=Streptomyces humicola TaxID=2953240 RepID=A0ABT1Q086_9ACTN|nr:M56 family metallopeptidase [Streptomyces humicola]MCQ4083336.1 M56 family metallopeptidase [Streptomyces humicola]